MKNTQKILIILILFLIFITLLIPFCFSAENEKISLGLDKNNDEYFLILDDTILEDYEYILITCNFNMSSKNIYFWLAYSNSPMVLKPTTSGKSYYLNSTNDDDYYLCSYILPKTDIDDFTIDLNFVSPTDGPNSYHSAQSGASELSIFVYSTFDVKNADTDEVLFSSTINNSGDDTINDSINAILSGSNPDIDSITNSIGNSDWSSSLNEDDKSTIEEAPKSISSAFGSIFDIFNFIGNIKNAMLEVWNMIDEASNVDFYHDTSYNMIYAPHIQWTFNNKYVQGTYTIFSFAWYLTYKQYGDAIITAFFYIAFILHVFKNLPNYVTGANSVASSLNSAMDDGRVSVNKD